MPIAVSHENVLVEIPAMEIMNRCSRGLNMWQELGDFNYRVAFLEYMVHSIFHPDPNDRSSETSEALTEYVSMQLGLKIHEGDDFAPLAWVALIVFFEHCKRRFPVKLISTFCKFHEVWDVNAFLEIRNDSQREKRYPDYVSAYIRDLTRRGQVLLREVHDHNIF